MRPRKAKAIADRFSNLDFDDDKLVSIHIHLAEKPGKRTSLDFVFEDDGTQKLKTLSFIGCGNIRLNADFDVLTANWFAQTGRLSAHGGPTKLEKMVRAHIKHWRTQYMRPSSKTQPVDSKISNIRGYTLFKIALHGGTIEVLAKNYRISGKR